MHPTPHTPPPDPITIRETAESISIEITKPYRADFDTSPISTQTLRDFLHLYLSERFSDIDPDESAVDELADESKARWWRENGEEFLRNVDRGERE